MITSSLEQSFDSLAVSAGKLSRQQPLELGISQREKDICACRGIPPANTSPVVPADDAVSEEIDDVLLTSQVVCPAVLPIPGNQTHQVWSTK